jgi:D-glycero-D-manno-heptose 1,7-bisphosphate phosphatase
MAVWKRCPSSWLDHKGGALFLDRDGVVVVERDYLRDPDMVELVPGAAETMRAATAAGYLIIGVSNQSGLGRGRFSPEDFSRVMERIDELLADQGTGFDGFYYCPHAPQDGCPCRKPAAGLLDEAAETCRWDARRSWVVGDKASDVELGRNGNMGAVLVRTGYGVGQEGVVTRLWENDPRVLVAADLSAAYAAMIQMDADDSSRGSGQ